MESSSPFLYDEPGTGHVNVNMHENGKLENGKS
jgi:hypothetical protein